MNAESIIYLQSYSTSCQSLPRRECQAHARCHECGTTLEANDSVVSHGLIKLQQKYAGGWGDVSVGCPPQHVEYQQCGSRGTRFSRSCRPNSISAST